MHLTANVIFTTMRSFTYLQQPILVEIETGHCLTDCSLNLLSTCDLFYFVGSRFFCHVSSDRTFQCRRWENCCTVCLHMIMGFSIACKNLHAAAASRWESVHHCSPYSLLLALCHLLMGATGKKQFGFHILDMFLSKSFHQPRGFLPLQRLHIKNAFSRLVSFTISLSAQWPGPHPPALKSCSSVTRSSSAGGGRVFTLPGRWVDLETRREK